MPQILLADYWSLLRPVTVIQAVGAWVVGRLLVVASTTGAPATTSTTVGDPKEWLAILVVYLS